MLGIFLAEISVLGLEVIMQWNGQGVGIVCIHITCVYCVAITYGS